VPRGVELILCPLADQAHRTLGRQVPFQVEPPTDVQQRQRRILFSIVYACAPIQGVAEIQRVDAHFVDFERFL